MNLSTVALCKVIVFSLLMWGAASDVRSESPIYDTQSSLALEPLSPDDLKELGRAVAIIKHNYAGHIDDQALMIAAIKGMASSLDPHSEFFDRAEFTRLREQLDGGFAGVGVQVGRQEGGLRVYAPIDDSPAAKAGIQAGDVIIRIDGASTQGLTLADGIRRMRGAAGSQVTLTINRDSEDRTLTVTVTRAFIQMPNVKVAIPRLGYGYVRIDGFNEQTIPELSERLRTLADNPMPLQGLVLDLRSNGGGILQSAVGVAAAFLPPDAIVVDVRERQPNKGHVYRATYADYQRPSFASDPLAHLPPVFKTVPLVVLINAQSESVTEVVAAALQESGRAFVLGQPTFGKGTIQSTGTLSDGAGLMLTVARYYTPTGRSIQNTGVVPDLEVDEFPHGMPPGFPPIREIDLPNRLANPLIPNDSALQARHARNVLERLQAMETYHSRSARQRNRVEYAPLEYGKPGDFMLRQALDWLQCKVARSATRQPETRACSQ